MSSLTPEDFPANETVAVQDRVDSGAGDLSKLDQGIASLEYRIKDATEALHAALSMGDMDGVAKYARQIKRYQRDLYDVREARGKIGKRPGAWSSARFTKEQRSAWQIGGRRAAKALSTRRNAGKVPEDVVSVKEEHYGFTTKYIVKFRDGTHEIRYHAERWMDPFIRRRNRRMR